MEAPPRHPSCHAAVAGQDLQRPPRVLLPLPQRDLQGVVAKEQMFQHESLQLRQVRDHHHPPERLLRGSGRSPRPEPGPRVQETIPKPQSGKRVLAPFRAGAANLRDRPQPTKPPPPVSLPRGGPIRLGEVPRSVHRQPRRTLKRVHHKTTRQRPGAYGYPAQPHETDRFPAPQARGGSTRQVRPLSVSHPTEVASYISTYDAKTSEAWLSLVGLTAGLNRERNPCSSAQG